VTQAIPAAPVRANQNRANRNQVNPNPAIQLRTRPEEANPIQATPATVSPTATAILLHPVAAIRARAIPVVVIAVNLIVHRVPQRVRRATVNRKANPIPKIQAAIATQCRATRIPVIQVVAVPRLPVNRAIARAIARAIPRAIRKAIPKASQKANQTVNRVPKANHQAAIVRRADPVAIGRVTAKATAFRGRPVIQRVVLLVIRRADLAVVQRVDLKVILRRQPAIRVIHQPATQMIRQQVIPQIHPRAILMTLRPASQIARV